MTDRCEALREDLALYVICELDSGARADVERHLSDCAACRQELQKLTATLALLGPVPDYQLTELETARLEVQVYRRLAAETTPWWRSNLLRVAAAVALVVLGFWGRSWLPAAQEPASQEAVLQTQLVQLEEFSGQKSALRLTPEGLQLIARGRGKPDR
jgi:anti-sigma factor RsiW